MNLDISRLGQTGSREKIHDDAMNLKLPKEVKALLKEIGAGKGGASVIARDAIYEYLAKRGY